MRKRIFAANWKMNHGPTAAAAFIEQFRGRWKPGGAEVVFFPSALAFAAVRAAAGEPRSFRLGVQNVYAADRGAFTGENSAPIARDAGADYVLVGHSERRHVFGETNEMVAAKCAAIVRAGLTPILCVGETLEQREADDTAAIVTDQLRAGLALLDADQAREVVVAYEPVWAIGTGRNATPADAANTHGVLRMALGELLGSAAGDVSILYGGSVTPTNVAALLAASDVDGVLVGGASLELESWLSICSH